MRRAYREGFARLQIFEMSPDAPQERHDAPTYFSHLPGELKAD